ncbi:helix-turn-helix domain-containing protein (plasmid) [Streptomyces sp. NBC_01224]|uniref:helix-turn-helix domain-containing protein n=1 Tax=Streptomyces sp. NBC_01224 TaxID=2903783 RepID=UPI002E10477F|nr:helix-turn-helix domain-containing protein [Streptomyces sp. NBC_01224]
MIDSSPVAAPTADAPATAADRPVSAPVASSAPRTTDGAAFARPADRAPARKDVTASVAAAHAAAGRVSARVDVVDQEPPAEKAGPVKDWDLAGLPADCAPGRAPELLTDTQAHARIRYGHKHGWSQRRVATFAGRSPSTIHKHYSALAAE